MINYIIVCQNSIMVELNINMCCNWLLEEQYCIVISIYICLVNRTIQ